MRPDRRLLSSLLLGSLLTVATLSGQPAREAPRVLSYGALGQQVRGLKGKVVVVYFWSFG